MEENLTAELEQALAVARRENPEVFERAPTTEKADFLPERLRGLYWQQLADGLLTVQPESVVETEDQQP